MPATAEQATAATSDFLRVMRERGYVHQNRRWDSDYLTLRKLIDAGALGTITRFESRVERYSPQAVGNASVSGETAKLIDSEVRSIIDNCYSTAQQILTDKRAQLEAMADALMKYETIDADQIDDIMAGRTPREPRDWSGGGSGSAGTPVKEGELPSSPIGGPAAQH